MKSKSHFSIQDLIRKLYKKAHAYGIIGKFGDNHFAYAVTEKEGLFTAHIITIHDERVIKTEEFSKPSREEANAAIKEYITALKTPTIPQPQP